MQKRKTMIYRNLTAATLAAFGVTLAISGCGANKQASADPNTNVSNAVAPSEQAGTLQTTNLKSDTSANTNAKTDDAGNSKDNPNITANDIPETDTNTASQQDTASNPVESEQQMVGETAAAPSIQGTVPDNYNGNTGTGNAYTSAPVQAYSEPDMPVDSAANMTADENPQTVGSTGLSQTDGAETRLYSSGSAGSNSTENATKNAGSSTASGSGNQNTYRQDPVENKLPVVDISDIPNSYKERAEADAGFIENKEEYIEQAFSLRQAELASNTTSDEKLAQGTPEEIVGSSEKEQYTQYEGIINGLRNNQYYALVDVRGLTSPVLLVTDEPFKLKNGDIGATQASFYVTLNDGSVISSASEESAGSAYPFAVYGDSIYWGYSETTFSYMFRQAGQDEEPMYLRYSVKHTNDGPVYYRAVDDLTGREEATEDASLYNELREAYRKASPITFTRAGR